MNSWEQVKQIFNAALEVPATERVRFVEQACCGNNEMQAEVNKLLAADERVESFLENSILEHLNRTQELHLFQPKEMISGRFEIICFLGQGGMGEVYEAHDLELGEHVALKTIRPEIASDDNAILRFKREIQLARRVTHPSVCRIFDLGHHRPTDRSRSQVTITFLTMQLLRGQTLAQRLRSEGRLNISDALPLCTDMAEALAAAHDVGVIHRDFKPSNVVLTSQMGKKLHAIVTDFGLARSVLPESRLMNSARSATASGHLIGTIDYMAPEQLEGGLLTVATDIYSLGLVMYEMVTNVKPYRDGVFARLKGPPLPPSAVTQGLDPRWDIAILRCLQVDPSLRYQGARQVVAEIGDDSYSSRLKDYGLSSTTLVGKLPKKKFASKVSRTWLGLLSAVFLAIVAVAISYAIRMQARVPFAERDWVLVTDFKNNTGEKTFDRIIRDLAMQSLGQSAYVNVVPRITAIEGAKRTGSQEVDQIDEHLGRQICLREGYRAFLTGEIRKVGLGYRLEMTLGDPHTSSPVIRDSELMRSSDELYVTLDRLAMRVRHRLGESLARIEKVSKPLAQATTTSIEALQRYSLALDLYGAGEFTRCIPLAKDAVERDPNFAMAHLLLGRSYDQLGDGNDARKEFGLARSGLSRVGEREQHLILAVDYSAQGLDEKSREEYQHLLDIYPDDIYSLSGLSETSFWTGRIPEAINAQRRALELNPNSPDVYDVLMTLLVRTSQFDEALAVYRQAELRKISTAKLRFEAGLATWGRGDIDTARRAFEALGEENSDYWKITAQLYRGRLLAYEGRMLEANQAFRNGLLLVQQPGWEGWIPVFRYLLAQAQFTRGQLASAREESEKLAAAAKATPTPENLGRAGRLAIEVGDLSAASRFENLTKQSAVNKGAFAQMQFYRLMGDINLAHRRTVVAIENQEQALTFRKGFEPYLSLGMACDQLKNWRCSIEAYKSYLALKGEIIRDDFSADWVITHSRLAKACQSSGEQEEALHYYDAFLKLFSAADIDLPVLMNAKRESANLRAGLRSRLQ
jgi:serine/threonine protein kinase/tetratricopeptide (TPR) repeat protein